LLFYCLLFAIFCSIYFVLFTLFYLLCSIYFVLCSLFRRWHFDRGGTRFLAAGAAAVNIYTLLTMEDNVNNRRRGYLRLLCSGTIGPDATVPKRGAPARIASAMKDGSKWP
jgi:hypothetical protein